MVENKRGENLMKIYMRNGGCLTLDDTIEDVYNEILALKKKKKEYFTLIDSDTCEMVGVININDISYMAVDGKRRKDEDN